MTLKCVLYLCFSLLMGIAFSDSDILVLDETEFTPVEYVRATYIKAAGFNWGFNYPFPDELFPNEEYILEITSADTLTEYIKEGVQTLQPLLIYLKKAEMEKMVVFAREYTFELEDPIANKSEMLYNREYSSSPITADFYDINLSGMNLSKAESSFMRLLQYTPGVLTVNGKHNFQIDGQSLAGNFSYDIIGAIFSIRYRESTNRGLSYMFKIEESLKYDKISNGNVTFLPGAKTKDDLLMRKLHLEAFMKANLLLTSLSKITDLSKLQYVRQLGFRIWHTKAITTYKKKIIPNLANLLKLYLKKMAIKKSNSTLIISDINGKPITFMNIDNFRLEQPQLVYRLPPMHIIIKVKATYNDSKAIIDYKWNQYQVNSITLDFETNMTFTGDINVDFSNLDLSYVQLNEIERKYSKSDADKSTADKSTADTLNLFVKQVFLKFIREALNVINKI